MNPLVFLYIGLALLNIWAAFTHDFTLNLATKPLLMIVLSLYFYQKTTQKIAFSIQKSSFWLLLGLIFSISGDTWLLWDDDLSFILGLGSFLVAHLCYFIAFYKFSSKNKGLLPQKPWLAIPMLLFWVSINYILWDKL